MLRTTILLGLLTVMGLGKIDTASADTSWMPRWLGGKSDEVTASKHSATPKTAKSRPASGKKTSNPFSGLTDWFAPKKKKRVVSKYPPERPRVSHQKGQDDRPWYSRLFVPAEPRPPQSVGEWMELEQIKP